MTRSKPGRPRVADERRLRSFVVRLTLAQIATLRRVRPKALRAWLDGLK